MSWFDKKCSNQDVGTSRLIDNSGTKTVVIGGEASKTIGKRSRTEIGASADNDSGRLTGRMRIDNVNFGRQRQDGSPASFVLDSRSTPSYDSSFIPMPQRRGFPGGIHPLYSMAVFRGRP